MITNAEFLKAIFPPLRQNEYLWSTSFVPSPLGADPSCWKGHPVHNPADLGDFPHGNGYYSVAVLKSDGTSGYRRIKANFSYIPIIVADDVEGEVECTYRLQTSEGKCQVCWKLDEAITDIGVAERMHKALADMDYMPADKSGNNVVRYVRLPVQTNTKYEPHFPGKLDIWSPDRVFTLEELCEILSINYDYILNGDTHTTALKTHQNDAGARVDDSEYIRLICTGESLHESINVLAARYVARGMKDRDVVNTIKSIMGAHSDGSERFNARINEVERSVRGAVEKFSPDKGEEQTSSGLHHLANYVDYDLVNIEADTFVLDDLICDTVTLIAGSHGVGKTTQLVPLFARVAWLCGLNDPLRPMLRRRVIYIAEDPKQVIKILAAMYKNGCFGSKTMAEIKDWFRVVPAKRMRPEAIVRVVSEYRKCAHLNRNESNGREYLAQPTVVFDTSNSTFEIENESDNAEVGKAIALLKSEFGAIPVQIVSHVAKALKRADLSDFSARGAGAWEGDVNQVAYLVFDDDKDMNSNKRWLEIGISKHRFSTEIQGVLFDAYVHTIDTTDVLGRPKSMKVLYGVPEVVSHKERMQQVAERVQAKKAERTDELRGKILDAVEQLWETSPKVCNKAAINDCVTGNAEEVRKVISTLLDEKWLVEIEIPKEWRPNNNTRFVIVRLTEPQRKDFEDTEVCPVTVDDIPKRWMK
jgi:hypothetical protein